MVPPEMEKKNKQKMTLYIHGLQYILVFVITNSENIGEN